MIAEQPFSGGIDISEAAIEPGGKDHGAGRVKQFLERFGERRHQLQGAGIMHQQANGKDRGGGDGSKHQERIKSGAGGQTRRNSH